MTTDLPLIPETTAAAASHGSFCPKLCSFACPVHEATAAETAVPWSFHRRLDDLAAGRTEMDADLGHSLAHCTGCLRCQTACEPGQDVPEQVRVLRGLAHATGSAPTEVATAVEAVSRGRSPYGTPRPSQRSADPEATVVLVAGCRDAQDTVAATVRLFEAAGERVSIAVPEGCCGGLLRDLGATPAAERARAQLASTLEGPSGARVVALDPHCLPELPAGSTDAVSALARLEEAGRLRFSADPDAVTYHDPCLLARREGVVEPPRHLLRAANAVVVEPEQAGRDAGCSGAGMGMDLLDPAAADATARRRAERLTATNASTVLTACSGARARLRDTGAEVGDLFAYLAARLDESTAPSTTSEEPA